VIRDARIFRRLGAVLPASLLALPLAAQGVTQRDTTAARVGELVVSATRAQTTLEHMALHTSVITRAQIIQSPAQTLDQVLRDLQGVNLSGAPYYVSDPTGHQMRIRGVTNSKVLVLLDGIPIHDPFFSTTQWYKVPVSSIERVEVVRGGSSSTWGNLAVAGVVNIITRRPTSNQGQIDLSYQSFNTTNASIARDIVVSPRLALRLSGDLLKTDGYQTTPEDFLSSVPGKSASSATNGNAQVAAYYTGESGFKGFVKAGYHRQNQDIGGYQFGTNLQRGPDASAGFTTLVAGATRADVKVWGQWVSFDKQNGAGCYLASASSCNTTATTAPLVQYANSEDRNPYREFGASATLATAFTSFPASLQYGVDFRRISGEDSATTYNKPTTTDASSASINRTNIGQGGQQFLGGFLQLTYFPVRRLQATLSLREDRWSNTNGLFRLTKFTNGVAGTPLGGPLDDSHYDAFDPSLSARAEVNDHVAFRGAVYRSFRAPGLNNLYRSFSSTTSITIANPRLSPETLTGGEVGADFQARRVALSLTGFQYNTKGLIASYKIQSAATAPPDVVAVCGATLSNCPATVNFNTNSQDALSKGIELTASVQLARAIALDAGYTYTDSHYTASTTGDPIGVQLGAVPKNLITLGVAVQPTRAWVLNFGLRHTDSMYLDVGRTIPQAPLTLVNVSSSYRVTPRMELYGSVVNLTNEVYSDNATTSASSKTLGMPRAFTGGIRWRF
jgi:iron complex outermembrane receptor protein